MFFLIVFTFFGLSAEEEAATVPQGVSYCCEKLKDGNWCQNAPLSECDTSGSLEYAPTSCVNTNYCKAGTCVDTKEGLCFPNTGRANCEIGDEGNRNGRWYDLPRDEVPQCSQGCCLIGSQVAFVTKVRCLGMSSHYGIEANFRADVQSEVECISLSSPDVKGACVTEGEFDRTCKFTTKSECQGMEGEFFQDYLCTHEDLKVNCVKTPKTTCIEGDDRVFYVDSCGNPANVYDGTKYEGKENNDYWNLFQPADCQVDDENYETCGNCNYLGGSTCAPEKDAGGRTADIGDYVCRSLSCEREVGGETKTFRHGETWCDKPTDDAGTNNPGGRHFRLMCYNGEVTTEPCAEYRQEICIGNHASEEVPFRNAACRVNRWRDCYSQNNKESCEDTSRDCKWQEGASILKDETGLTLVVNDRGELVPREIEDGFNLWYAFVGKQPPLDKIEEKRENWTEAACVPKYSPGFDFWGEEGDAAEVCQIANTQCVVKYKSEGILAAFNPDDEEQNWTLDKERTIILCLDENGNYEEQWKTNFSNLCLSLGDCGVKVNYLGSEGSNTDDDIFEIIGKLGVKEEDENQEEE